MENKNNMNDVLVKTEEQEVMICKEEKEQKVVKLTDAANYLIQQFYRTKERYSCTQTKLGKILSIIAFRYAKLGKKLFEEKIYKYNPDCGTLIPELRLYDRDIYFQIDYMDDKKIVDEHFFDESVQIPEIYNETSSLTNEVRLSIDEAFRIFGSFSGKDLAKAINSVVNCDGVVGRDDVIDLTAIRYLSRNDVPNLIINKELVDYLFSESIGE